MSSSTATKTWAEVTLERDSTSGTNTFCAALHGYFVCIILRVLVHRAQHGSRLLRISWANPSTRAYSNRRVKVPELAQMGR